MVTPFFDVTISTHALREEGDPVGLSGKRARLAISTHALREEGDLGHGDPIFRCHHFYPRPPRGGRQKPVKTGFRSQSFLPTPSARRAT